jgi:hypothetical protein
VVLGCCGFELSIGQSFRECVGDEAEDGDLPLEPSWEPSDNAAESWTADRKAGDVLEHLQALDGFDDDPAGRMATALIQRSEWN